MKKLIVNLKENSYPIIIENGLAENIKANIETYLPNFKGKRYFIITNKTVASLYRATLQDFEHVVEIEDGEEYKNFKTYEYIITKLLENKIERGDVIIAFGGGVVGDMAGFAAATILRGVDYVQIPTTLLSQVDSSVGGKTGFNHPAGKNLIGAFKQPKLVLIDPKTLDTLDIRQIKTGLGEVLKYSFIEKSTGVKDAGLNNISFSEYLKNLVKTTSVAQTQHECRQETLYKNLAAHWEEIIYASVLMKAAVVEKDECEKGLRAILNFGHTFGHSVEKITEYKKYTHGEAVAAGMVMAFTTACKRMLIDREYFNSSVKLIRDYGLISDDMKNFDKEKLYEGMKSDKKVSNNKIKLVLPVRPLEVQLFDDTEEPLIKDSLL